MLVLSQVGSEPGGLAGWVTAVTSVGLLGPVLYWLAYRHLPEKDRQHTELLDKKDRQLAAVLDDWRAEREQERASRHGLASTFQQAVAEIHDHCLDEAKQNRLAAVANLDRLAAEIRSQTSELAKIMQGSFSYTDHHAEGKK